MIFAPKFIATRSIYIWAKCLFHLIFSLCGSAGVYTSAQAQAPSATVAEASVLAPWAGTAEGAPLSPWRVIGLPGGKVPLLAPDIYALDGERVLRLRSKQSYGALSHALPPGSTARYLQWQWRLDQPLTGADLTRKDGDDAALKICALFDLPLDDIPFVERNLLRLARRISGEALPGATLCYLWDQALPAGTVLSNAYTARVRLYVLNTGSDPLGRWMSHRRDLHADFLAAFGKEASSIPPLLAIVAGADADNTGSASLGFVRQLQLMKQ